MAGHQLDPCELTVGQQGGPIGCAPSLTDQPRARRLTRYQVCERIALGSFSAPSGKGRMQAAVEQQQLDLVGGNTCGVGRSLYAPFYPQA